MRNLTNPARLRKRLSLRLLRPEYQRFPAGIGGPSAENRLSGTNAAAVWISCSPATFSFSVLIAKA
jgi:hypothetical protein